MSPMHETLNIIRYSFDNLASKSELRLLCFAHTLQLVAQNGSQEAICIKPAMVKVSKIAKLAHFSTAFAKKLGKIVTSIPKVNKLGGIVNLYYAKST